jgi:hypothetical protein
MKNEATVKAAFSDVKAVYHKASAGIQRDGESVCWCDSCGSHRPRHTCEWKILASIVLIAALVCVIGMWSLFSGLSLR